MAKEKCTFLNAVLFHKGKHGIVSDRILSILVTRMQWFPQDKEE